MVQSKVENRPPHTAKLPPTRGAFIRSACAPPMKRSPLGELYTPFRKWKAEPPTAPMPKALPMSSRMRSGQGSREVSGVAILVDDLEMQIRVYWGFNLKVEVFLLSCNGRQ